MIDDLATLTDNFSQRRILSIVTFVLRNENFLFESTRVLSYFLYYVFIIVIILLQVLVYSTFRHIIERENA